MKKIIPLIKSRIDPILASNTRLRIARGAIWGTVGTVATRSVTILLSFALARILGKDGFGEYGIINSTAAMISGFTGLGIGVTVTRYVASLRAREPERAGKIIGLSSIITWFSALLYGAVFIYFAPWLAKTTLAAPHLAPMLQISAISIGLGVVNSVQVSTLTGLEAFKASSILSTIFGIVQSVLVIVFAWYAGVKGAVIALALASSLTVIAYYVFSRRELNNAKIRVTIKEAWSEWRVLVKYSLPAFLGTITVGPVIWASNALLANQQHGYGQLGIYSAAMQWDAVVQFFPGLVFTAVLPVMSDLYGRGDKKGSIDLMWKMMKFTAFIVIPIASIVSLLSPLIIKGYGSSFSGGHMVIVIVVFTTVLSSISTSLGFFIAAAGRMWILFAINTAWGISFILFSFYMVKWGAEGIAGAKFLAYALHFIWSFAICVIFSRKLNRDHKSLLPVAPA
ncbi:MAG: oligosaccharide flippase family protein [Bacteroidota bacterium]